MLLSLVAEACNIVYLQFCLAISVLCEPKSNLTAFMYINMVVYLLPPEFFKRSMCLSIARILNSLSVSPCALAAAYISALRSVRGDRRSGVHRRAERQEGIKKRGHTGNFPDTPSIFMCMMCMRAGKITARLPRSCPLRPPAARLRRDYPSYPRALPARQRSARTSPRLPRPQAPRRRCTPRRTLVP